MPTKDETLKHLDQSDLIQIFQQEIQKSSDHKPFYELMVIFLQNKEPTVPQIKAFSEWKRIYNILIDPKIPNIIQPYLPVAIRAKATQNYWVTQLATHSFCEWVKKLEHPETEYVVISNDPEINRTNSSEDLTSKSELISVETTPSEVKPLEATISAKRQTLINKIKSNLTILENLKLIFTYEFYNANKEAYEALRVDLEKVPTMKISEIRIASRSHQYKPEGYTIENTIQNSDKKLLDDLQQEEEGPAKISESVEKSDSDDTVVVDELIIPQTDSRDTANTSVGQEDYKNKNKNRIESIATLLNEAYQSGQDETLNEDSLQWFNLMILYIVTEFSLINENKAPTREQIQSCLAANGVHESDQQKLLGYYQYLLKNRIAIYKNAPSNFLHISKPARDDMSIIQYMNDARTWLVHNAGDITFIAMSIKENPREKLINQLDKKLQRYTFFQEIFNIFGLTVPSVINDKINALTNLKENLDERRNESIQEVVNSSADYSSVLSTHTVGHLWKDKTATQHIVENAISDEKSIASSVPESLKRPHHR